MIDQEARYDRIAEGYAEWWSPVHRPGTLGLLDEIEDAVTGGATRILDVGCGTGALATAIVRRWPGVRVTGVDLSTGMLAIAAREVGASPAAETLAFVTWLAGGWLAADEAYDDALIAAGLEPRASGGHGDPATPEAAAAQVRRAGLAGVRAREGTVTHRYTPERYVAFVTRFDDEDLFASLEPDSRAALEADLLARLRALPPGGLDLRLPIVYATGRRSARV